ncbi:hypothetical protein TNCT_605121 [Trichonephila clavata]|uniref:Uncharacterized protein n=1 Tax=Trichonephila clavata TaxID=2740835 RepID=A0A8X6IK86_TRICU|nr:hypothetical protein TNCT_605121 [Trichonephila clavata]
MLIYMLWLKPEVGQFAKQPLSPHNDRPKSDLSLIAGFGQPVREMKAPLPNSLASAHRTLAREFRALREVAGQYRIYAIYFQYIELPPHAPANVRFRWPIRELAELQALAVTYIHFDKF